MTILHLFLALSTLAGASGRTSMPILQLIQAGQVDTAAINTDAVTTPKLLTSAVTNPKIAPLAVDSTKLAAASVDSEKLIERSVTGAKLVNLTVDSPKLGALSVDSEKLAKDSVDTEKVKADSITSAKVLTGAINSDKLASDAVTTAKIITAAVETGKLATDSVTSAKLLSSEASCTKVSGGDITCSGGAVTIPVSVSGVAASGGLGIGSTLNVIASSTTLDNATNATDALTVKVNSNDKGIIFKNSATDSMLWWLRRNGSADNAYMKFGNGGAESMVFNGAAQSISGAAASGGLGVSGAATVVGTMSVVAPTIGASVAGFTVKSGADGSGNLNITANFQQSGLADTPQLIIRQKTGLTDFVASWSVSANESMTFTPTAADGTQNEIMRISPASIGGLSIAGAATVVKSSFSITGDNSALVVLGAADTTKFIVQPGGSVGIGTASPGQKLEVAGNALIATGALDTNKIVMNVPAVLGSADSAKIGIGLVNPVGHLHVMSGSADTAKVSIGDATHGGCIMMGTTSGCFECGISGITFTCAADADCVCDGTF